MFDEMGTGGLALGGIEEADGGDLGGLLVGLLLQARVEGVPRLRRGIGIIAVLAFPRKKAEGGTLPCNRRLGLGRGRRSSRPREVAAGRVTSSRSYGGEGRTPTHQSFSGTERPEAHILPVRVDLKG